MKIKIKYFILIFFSTLTLSGYLSYFDYNLKIPSTNKTTNKLPVDQNNLPAKYNYDLDIDLINGKEIFVKCLITELQGISDSIRYFQLPANALESKSTRFAIDKNLDSTNLTSFEFKSIKVNDEESDYLYFRDTPNIFLDNSLLGIRTKKEQNQFYFEYKLKIPKGEYFLGSAETVGFIKLHGFYPIPVKDISYFSQFGVENTPISNYTVKIKYPKKYKLITSAKFIDNSYNVFVKEKAHSLSLFFVDNKTYKTEKFSVNNSEIELYSEEYANLFIERIKTTIKNGIHFYDSLGYKFNEKIVFVVQPRTVKESLFSSDIIAFNVDLFTPQFTKNPESDILKGISQLIFKQNLIVNENKDAWLVYGLSGYYSDKIYEKYYGNISQYFKLFEYLPIEGEVFYSYNELPIIYRFRNYEFKPYLDKMNDYYLQKNHLSINLNLKDIYDKQTFNFITKIKPSLSFQVIENYFGEEFVNDLIKEYISKNMLQEVNSEIFLKLFKLKKGKSANEFIQSLYFSNTRFDYSIEKLEKISKNKYYMQILKKGESSFPTEIAVYTTVDTVTYHWDGKEESKYIFFNSENHVLGAEIDPKTKNILDENIANNSISVSQNISTPFSFAIHWFFWVQNSLMFLGALS